MTLYQTLTMKKYFPTSPHPCFHSFGSRGFLDCLILQKNILQDIPYINIHKHGPTKSVDELAIRNIFAHYISEMDGNMEGLFSTGLHPWHIENKNTEEHLALVEKASKYKSVVVIGEIGLDRLTSASMEMQREVFVKQLEIAASVGKPVTIHCVKAHTDIVSIIKKTGFNGTVIFHGFNQNKQIAGQILKNGFYISFGNALMNPQSNASKLFAEIPNNKIFLETDETDIDIKEIYQRAADLKDLNIYEIKKMISINFTNCFNFTL